MGDFTVIAGCPLNGEAMGFFNISVIYHTVTLSGITSKYIEQNTTISRLNQHKTAPPDGGAEVKKILYLILFSGVMAR